MLQTGGSSQGGRGGSEGLGASNPTSPGGIASTVGSQPKMSAGTTQGSSNAGNPGASTLRSQPEMSDGTNQGGSKSFSGGQPQHSGGSLGADNCAGTRGNTNSGGSSGATAGGHSAQTGGTRSAGGAGSTTAGGNTGGNSGTSSGGSTAENSNTNHDGGGRGQGLQRGPASLATLQR